MEQSRGHNCSIMSRLRSVGISVIYHFLFILILPIILLYMIGTPLAFIFLTVFKLFRLPNRWIQNVRCIDPSASYRGPFFMLSILFGFLIVLVVGITLFIPVKGQVAIALFGLLAAAFAWSFRTTLKVMESRARLIIIESLSNKPGQSRTSLKQEVLRHSWLYRRFSNIYAQALDRLYAERSVYVTKGMFFLNSNDPEVK